MNKEQIAFEKWCNDNNIASMKAPDNYTYEAAFEVWQAMQQELKEWRSLRIYKKHPMQEVTPEVVQGQLDWFDRELRKYESNQDTSEIVAEIDRCLAGENNIICSTTYLDRDGIKCKDIITTTHEILTKIRKHLIGEQNVNN